MTSKKEPLSAVYTACVGLHITGFRTGFAETNRNGPLTCEYLICTKNMALATLWLYLEE